MFLYYKKILHTKYYVVFDKEGGIEMEDYNITEVIREQFNGIKIKTEKHTNNAINIRKEMIWELNVLNKIRDLNRNLKTEYS